MEKKIDKLEAESQPLSREWALFEYCEAIEGLPVACCLATDNSELEIMYANEAFCELIKISKEELRSQYGNRLGALSTDIPLIIKKGDLNKKVFVEQLLKCGDGQERYIKTQAQRVSFTDRKAIFCVCCDMSNEKQKELDNIYCQDALGLISSETKLEAFILNLETGLAQSLVFSPSILGISNDEQSKFGGLKEAIIAKKLVDTQYASTLFDVFAQIDKGNDASCEIKLLLKSKKEVWIKLAFKIKKSKNFKRRIAIGVFQDITQQKNVSLEYIQTAQFYQSILSQKTAYAQINVTHNRITRIGGMWNLYNEIIDKVTYTQIVTGFIDKVVHPEDRAHYKEFMMVENLTRSLENGIDRLSCQFRRIVELNKMMWMEINMHLTRDTITKDVLALGYLDNIDVKKREELKLLYEVERDQLTNIYNRQSAEAAISKCISDDRRGHFAFLIIDLDDFKEINDTYGHTTGDQVLVRISRILETTLRQNDIVGRFGGDEFILFLPHATRQNMEPFLNRLYARLSAENDPEISISAGVYCFDGGDSYDEIFVRADTALYQAKNNGKGQYAFYSEELSLNTEIRNHTNELSDQNRIITTPDPEAQTVKSYYPRLDDINEINAFDHFLSKCGDMAYLIDPETYDLIEGNDAFFNRIGMTRTQCIGLKCYETMQKRNSPCPFCGRANWQKDKFYLWRNLNESLEQEFLIKNMLVDWKDREVVLAIAVDISNNKSIVDSMDNGATESHCILSGIERMTEAEDLSTAMVNVLETIGFFFRADDVEFWQKAHNDTEYSCLYSWAKRSKALLEVDPELISRVLNGWINSKKWVKTIDIENQESVLGDSFEMYNLMKSRGIQNQRFIPLKDKDTILGILAISNITASFQNVSYMESLSGFITSEWKKRALMENMLYASSHDDLTGLLSRSSYESFMHEYDGNSIPYVGVLVTDINDLKGINVRRGFHMGDKFICEVSKILKKIFVNNKIFRLNGDEFLVICQSLDWKEFSKRTTDFQKQFENNKRFSVSSGCSWDDSEKDISLLISQANEMMQVNKKLYYDITNDVADNERREMLQELMSAFERKEFEVFLQPKVEFDSNLIFGAEALIRYRHPELGLMAPSKFIDLLEKNNFIRYVDLFVFREVCALLSDWKKKGKALPVISLNFSKLTLLETDILATVRDIFSQYDVPQSNVEIEITESVVDVGKSILFRAAQDLYEAGFSISLDDFGTKYTNLSILAEFNFDMLKIDRSLVNALANGADNQIILKNVITMCNDLRIGVIAEGVETTQQQDILKSLGCLYGQGYLYGKPMQINEFIEKYID